MVVKCCVCERVKKGERWVRTQSRQDRDESVSHGYCPRCAAKAMQDIRTHHLLKGMRTA